jgi:amino acid transporter
MPSAADRSAAHRGNVWLGIVRILLIQVIVLVALSAAIVGYLNWSSEMAWQEFVAATEPPAPKPKLPMQTVIDVPPCDRGI